MIFLCSGRIYKYSKWTFEYGMMVLSPIKKNGDPYKKIPNKFYDDIDGWLKLNDEDKERYRIGGGFNYAKL